MKQTLLFFILFWCSSVSGQQHLTKNEILKSYTSTKKNTLDTHLIVTLDSVLNIQLNKWVDSLNNISIDSIIIYTIGLPGYWSTSNCDTNFFPIYIYIIWHKNKITHLKTIRGNCSSEIIKNSIAYLFNQSDKNYQKMDSEYFMPIILGAEISKDKSISYSITSAADEPYYSIYYKIGKHGKSFQFSQSYLQDKKSLFHSYNLNLSAYHWWRRVEKEMDKID